MSNGAWAALSAVFLALFGAGGFFQWRRNTSTSTRVSDNTTSAAQSKAGIEALLPLIKDLQDRITDAEDSQIEVMILLAAHNEWDMRVLQEIRKHYPDFPDPPPLKPRKEMK